VTDAVERLRTALADRYAIERELGQGGMATVYLAQDRKLGRAVALKVLRPELAASLGGERFLREIEIAAKLAHPHILALFDCGEAEGLLYYTMPFVEGETLRDRLIREKQLPLEDALRITREVADALGYAHSRGLVHRDIKPENILFAAGHAVVSDFGIARAVSAAGGAHLTETGLAIGTPAYMSPEQAAGARELDARTDIYSLGCVLYEMLAGEPPFTGPTAQIVMARKSADAVPSLRTSRETVSAALEAAVLKALAKVPADRYPTAAAFAAALTGAPEDGAQLAFVSGEPRALTPPRGIRVGVRARLVRTILWGVALLVAGAAFWFGRRSAPGEAAGAVTVSTITLPDSAPVAFIGSSPYSTGMTALALSSDGSTFAYVAQRGSGTQLYLRPMDRDTAFPVAGTEGACCLFFSPDGAWLAFHAEDQIRKVRIGIPGAPVTVMTVNSFNGADWGDDGWIVVSDMQSRRSVRVNAKTGTLDTLQPPLFRPKVLPGGRGLLSGRSVMIPRRHQIRTLLAAGSDARYVPTGHLTYAFRGELWAVPFDVNRLEVTGEPFAALPSLRTESYGDGQYTFSRNGALVYAPGTATSLSRLVAHHRSGRVDALHFEPAVFSCLSLSPDGRRLAVRVGDPGTGQFDLWIYDVARQSRLRLTSGDTVGCPTWSPDGSRVAYRASSGGDFTLFSQKATGGDRPSIVHVFKGERFNTCSPSWSADGERMALCAIKDSTRGDVLVLDLDRAAAMHSVAATTAYEWGGIFSPDGRWIAYSSNESGADEIYVQPYPPTGQRWRVSRDGGEAPLWTRGGRELVYRTGQQWWTVSVTTAPQFAAGEPALLARGPYINTSGVEYAVSPDGERLYVEAPVTGPPTTNRLTVVTNFFTVLRDLSRQAKR
jgi:serine/threonine-protein kinase